ncbi:MAG TPA: pyridoxamine 5'-phosphate oxidase family protein [Candidatus Binatia bacterium]|nr:pyridoxamine 5'-phosphate oxidase family protein [Candidatus Binatia bacterium]
MATGSFEEIRAEFERRVQKIVWCTVATVDERGRPRSRVLHPIWEGAVGWIATGRRSRKAKDLAHTPYLSCAYWTPEHEQIYAECRAEWEDRIEEKRRLWDLFKTTPAPMGYDPGLFWKDAADPDCGFLRLTPWRIELSSLQDLFTRTPPRVWRP